MPMPETAEELLDALTERLKPIWELQEKFEQRKQGISGAEIDPRSPADNQQALWHEVESLSFPSPDEITRTIHSFPSLREADGGDPFDADRFIAWLAKTTSPTEQPMAYYAGWFVASRYCPRRDQVLAFQEPLPLHRAFAAWDRPHRLAYARWLMRPRYHDGIHGDYYAS